MDWAIKIGETIIAITEAKKEDLDQGVGQNLIQLQASSQCNVKKRSYDSALREEIMFGIVTTGIEWVVIKLTYNGNSTNDIQVEISSLSPSQLPLSGRSLQPLHKPLEDLFRQLIWVLDQQMESQNLPKLRRTCSRTC